MDTIDNRRDFLMAASTLAALAGLPNVVFVDDGEPSEELPTENLSWVKLPNFPSPFRSSITVIRGSTVWNDDLYISMGGSGSNDSQCWRWDGLSWQVHSWFSNSRMNFLTVDEANSLVMGLGTQRAAGSARVWKYFEAGGNAQIGGNLSGDISYSHAWFNGELHVGLMSEDNAGSARLVKWNGSAWVNVFAPGVNGVPTSYTYAGIYETWVSGGKLHVGTMSHTVNDADVWRLEPTGWVNLGGMQGGSGYVLASVDYDDKMVVAWGGDGALHPVRYYDDISGQWVNLGNTPAEWAGAHIFNHMAVFKGKLYLGIGGASGKLSVWRLEDGNWVKVGGNGVNGSWTSPINSGATEWVYRLQECDQKLYACMAGSNLTCQVWELTV
jgi:hypothetical protein